ncbi:exocyst complex component 6B-like [Orycteropus afer afer]|uniref:Exocyst complex component 6B-like n=1 Tax=Orycteropus afer afer TaxID=1230840 RepID=A0AC54Z9Y7_ORYAF|nr:exocyst complex component 6B-like [Orycteropus afer afer]
MRFKNVWPAPKHSNCVAQDNSPGMDMCRAAEHLDSCFIFDSEFARSGPVPGFQEDTLQLAFIDLRQLLDLFIQWDWSTYLADYGQPNCKYLRVNPVTALTLLEKMKDTSRKNNMFAQFRKNERDKQKLIDTVAKQLRGLISSHHS